MTDKKQTNPAARDRMSDRTDFRFHNGYVAGGGSFPHINVFELPPRMDLRKHLRHETGEDLDKKK